MHEALRPILKAILANPLLHARLLNSLSYAEYLGARKIFKSQCAEEVSLEVLRHAQDESRHALLLKSLAVRLGGKTVAHYDAGALIGRDAVNCYFQRLDAQLAGRCQGAPRATYSLVTHVVEKRALAFYQLYLELNPQGPESAPVAALIREEERHLSALPPIAGVNPDSFRALEEEAFRPFLAALSQAL